MQCVVHTAKAYSQSRSYPFPKVSTVCRTLQHQHLYCTAAREFADDEEFRIFKKQIYHAALAQILSPLHPGMTTPHVMRCPDGHYRRVIFELGPFIADYPEQVYLSGVVYGWCPK